MAPPTGLDAGLGRRKAPCRVPLSRVTGEPCVPQGWGAGKEQKQGGLGEISEQETRWGSRCQKQDQVGPLGRWLWRAGSGTCRWAGLGTCFVTAQIQNRAVALVLGTDGDQLDVCPLSFPGPPALGTVWACSDPLGLVQKKWQRPCSDQCLPLPHTGRHSAPPRERGWVCHPPSKLPGGSGGLREGISCELLLFYALAPSCLPPERPPGDAALMASLPQLPRPC